MARVYSRPSMYRHSSVANIVPGSGVVLVANEMKPPLVADPVIYSPAPFSVFYLCFSGGGVGLFVYLLWRMRGWSYFCLIGKWNANVEGGWRKGVEIIVE